MIQKLQRRFTLLVLGVLLVILAGVVFAINYVNWKELTDQAEASLELIVKNNGQRPGMMDRPDGSFPPPWAQTESSGTGDVVLDSQDWDDGEDEDAAEDAASDDKDDEVDGGNHYEDFIDDVLDEEDLPPASRAERTWPLPPTSPHIIASTWTRRVPFSAGPVTGRTCTPTSRWRS